MPRQTRQTKTKAVEEEEDECPPPLIERLLAMGRNVPSASSSSSSSTQTMGRGLLLLAAQKKQLSVVRPGQDMTPHIGDGDGKTTRPSRIAKSRAIQALLPEELDHEDESESETGIEEDDVAFQHIENDESDSESEDGVSDSDCRDDTLYNDQLDDMSLSETDSDDSVEQVATSYAGLTSPSGMKWSETKAPIGREHLANIFTGKRGFMTGLRPLNEKEAFLSVFGELIKTAIIYTNKSGKRWANANRGQKWKSVDEDEMLAFIGE